jgi:HEPN domain-containing protein
MSKTKKSSAQPTSPVPTDSSLANNFAKLGDEYLQASKMLNDGFKGAPKWPTYQNAFLALENFLKAYLLLKGATLEQGHDLRSALNEAKAKGLVLKVAQAVEDVVMKISDYYTTAPHAGSGGWAKVSPYLVITFADQVRRDARL